MIGYTTLGVNDFDKALSFYDELLGSIGGKRVFETPNGQVYGFSQGPMFGVYRPENGKPATIGNGSMIALNCGSKENVEKAYALALKLGGSDEGAAGPRGDSGFYGAYFRDLDGNKLCAYSMG